MFANRWHHALHWELDFPEALTAGREDLYLGFFYRNWGARPDAIAEEDQREYLRTYRQPGAMRAGFNLYRATAQDVEDNQAFLAQGKLDMPVLCYGGTHGRHRVVAARGERCARRPRRGLRPVDSGRAPAVGVGAVACSCLLSPLRAERAVVGNGARNNHAAGIAHGRRRTPSTSGIVTQRAAGRAHAGRLAGSTHRPPVS